VETHALWADLTVELVAEVVADAPWIDGIEEVCADIAERGERSMLITMSPNFFAEHLGVRGIDVVRASRWPAPPFAAPIDPAGILSPADKVRLTEAERAAHGLPRGACVAYRGEDLREAYARGRAMLDAGGPMWTVVCPGPRRSRRGRAPRPH
jgi:phosphoserine phosphatase